MLIMKLFGFEIDRPRVPGSNNNMSQKSYFGEEFF